MSKDEVQQGSGVDVKDIHGYGWPLSILMTLILPISLPVLIYHYLQKRWQNKKMHGKVVVITGASSGLGEALAHTFYAAGCRLILSARRKEVLERVSNDIMRKYTTSPTYPPVVLPVDLEVLNDLPVFAERATAIYGHVDILINNAGMSYRGEALNTALDVDIKVMVTNYFAQVALTKAFLPKMLSRNSGHIVAIGSIQGKMGIPFRSCYTASKHACEGFYDSLRAELAGTDIKVTVVSPGYIKTNLSVNAITDTGANHGVMDATTASGEEPVKVAATVLSAVVQEKAEVITCSYLPRVALWLRFLCPPLYFMLMRMRANKHHKLAKQKL